MIIIIQFIDHDAWTVLLCCLLHIVCCSYKLHAVNEEGKLLIYVTM